MRAVRYRTQRTRGTGEPPAARNRLLARLPQADYARLSRHLEEVSLDARRLVFDVDEEITHVYFPLTGVLSMIAMGADGAAVEVATIGSEGMAGLPLVLGVRRTNLQAFSQVPGKSLRLGAAALARELARKGALRRVLDLYTQALFVQVAQASACNRLHAVEERCARWLLQTEDRAGDEFELSHQFLAQMLGVRRASVSEVLARFQARGLVSYSRGKMRVRDRAALERTSCECYALIQSEYDRLLGDGGGGAVAATARARASVGGISTAGVSPRAD